jgi:hypothetical protein
MNALKSEQQVNCKEKLKHKIPRSRTKNKHTSIAVRNMARVNRKEKHTIHHDDENSMPERWYLLGRKHD